LEISTLATEIAIANLKTTKNLKEPEFWKNEASFVQLEGNIKTHELIFKHS
jgi:hypothetical protein